MSKKLEYIKNGGSAKDITTLDEEYGDQGSLHERQGSENGGGVQNENSTTIGDTNQVKADDRPADGKAESSDKNADNHTDQPKPHQSSDLSSNEPKIDKDLPSHTQKDESEHKSTPEHTQKASESPISHDSLVSSTNAHREPILDHFLHQKPLAEDDFGDDAPIKPVADIASSKEADQIDEGVTYSL